MGIRYYNKTQILRGTQNMCGIKITVEGIEDMTIYTRSYTKSDIE